MIDFIKDLADKFIGTAAIVAVFLFGYSLTDGTDFFTQAMLYKVIGYTIMIAVASLVLYVANEKVKDDSSNV